MKKLLLVAATVVACVSSHQCANAEDQSYLQPMWSGAYLGLQGGYGLGNNNNTVGGATPYSADFGNPVLGGHAGWQSQTDSFVWGLESDIEYSALKADITSVAGNKANTKIDAMGSLRGRMGYSFNNVLVYGTTGLALGHIQYSIQDTIGNAERHKKTIAGYAIGGGVDYALTDHLTLGLEYRYLNFGRAEVTSALFPTTPFAASYKVHTLRSALSWRF